MADQSLRAADILARRLYAAGCRHAFGMPGGEVLTVVDALRKAGIRFVLCKHENAAGFMAEAVHHRDGAPAILVATLGPGVLNAVNVVANAQQDRVPLIVISGCADADEVAQYTHQIADHQAVLGPVTKASYRFSAGAAAILADKAVSLALQPRCGPVHIDVPVGVAAKKVPSVEVFHRPPASPVAPVEDDLQTARDWLAVSERPFAILGPDVMGDQSGPAVQAFLEKIGIPFVTSYKAKGVIDEDHPLCLGGCSISPLADSHLLPLVERADLVLSIGYDPIEMRPGWRNAWDPVRQNVIDIVAEPNLHYMHQAGLNFIADTGATVAALSEGVKPRATWPGGEPDTARAGLAAAFPATDEWGPAGVIAEAQDVLPPDALISVDTGAHRILLAQMWRTHEARQMIQSTGLCTMGCALPMAIGTKLAEPDRAVVGFTGDAGMLMGLGELATAGELGVAPIIVVFVDASIGLIEMKQRQRQLANVGVDMDRQDFAAIARAFGGNGETVRNRAELRVALEAALSADRFTVIAAEIEAGGYDGRI